MIYTQKQIYDYLVANPLGVNVSIGDTENLNGEDYLFLDYTNDALISSENRGVYQSYIQITLATLNFSNRKKLVEYVKQFLTVSIDYDKSFEFEYYVARCTCGVLMYEEERFDECPQCSV